MTTETNKPSMSQYWINFLNQSLLIVGKYLIVILLKTIVLTYILNLVIGNHFAFKFELWEVFLSLISLVIISSCTRNSYRDNMLISTLSNINNNLYNLSINQMGQNSLIINHLEDIISSNDSNKELNSVQILNESNTLPLVPVDKE